MTSTYRRLRNAALVTAATTMMAAMPAMAASLIGLAGDKTLVTIDPATRMVTATATVSGVPGLVGIDVRPADGMLWGLATDGRIVTVDPMTSMAMVKSTLSEKLTG